MDMFMWQEKLGRNQLQTKKGMRPNVKIAVVSLCAISIGLGAFLVYRKRQLKKSEAEALELKKEIVKEEVNNIIETATNPFSYLIPKP